MNGKDEGECAGKKVNEKGRMQVTLILYHATNVHVADHQMTRLPFTVSLTIHLHPSLLIHLLPYTFTCHPCRLSP